VLLKSTNLTVQTLEAGEEAMAVGNWLVYAPTPNDVGKDDFARKSVAVFPDGKGGALFFSSRIANTIFTFEIFSPIGYTKSILSGDTYLTSPTFNLKTAKKTPIAASFVEIHDEDGTAMFGIYDRGSKVPSAFFPRGSYAYILYTGVNLDDPAEREKAAEALRKP
jgi:hypothetical protein